MPDTETDPLEPSKYENSKKIHSHSLDMDVGMIALTYSCTFHAVFNTSIRCLALSLTATRNVPRDLHWTTLVSTLDLARILHLTAKLVRLDIVPLQQCL